VPNFRGSPRFQCASDDSYTSPTHRRHANPSPIGAPYRHSSGSSSPNAAAASVHVGIGQYSLYDQQRPVLIAHGHE